MGAQFICLYDVCFYSIIQSLMLKSVVAEHAFYRGSRKRRGEKVAGREGGKFKFTE
jgi:hypothetical protein